MNTTEIGRNFEQIIGKLYEAEGFEVSYNQMVRGRSGATYEIDVLGQKKADNEDRKGFFKFLKPKKRTVNLAVECKYKDSGLVDHKDVSVFLNKLDDLGIDVGVMATNRDLTENGKLLAHYRKIKTLNGKEVNQLCNVYGVDYRCSRGRLEVDGPLTDAIKTTFKLFDTLGIF